MNTGEKYYQFSIFSTCCLVTASCLTPMDCSPPGSSVHGISQATILELPFPSPGDLTKPGIECASPALQANSLLTEPPGKPQKVDVFIFSSQEPYQTKRTIVPI